MKNKFTTLILLIIMILLFGIIAIFFRAMYLEIGVKDIVNAVQTANTSVPVEEGKENDTVVENKTVAESLVDLFSGSTTSNKDQEYTYVADSSQGKYFYEQLSNTQKIIYNGLQENKENMISGTYVVNFGNTFSDILSQENGSKILGDDYQTAIEAYTHDNPDLFYLDINKLYLNMEVTKKAFTTKYNVYIGPQEGKNYYDENFNNETEVRIAIRKIEEEKNRILSKMTGNTYKDIKIIHDYLINNIEYDKQHESIGTYSIYGALIDGKCVCEGYARTFKYLADYAGIQCLLMQGNGINSEGQIERHAWNAVYLDESWYYIDVTWNDPIIIGTGIYSHNVHYKYFLKGTRTFEKDHVVEYQFSENGKVFSYPQMSYTDY